MNSASKLFSEISNSVVTESCGDGELNIVGYYVPVGKMDELETLLKKKIKLPTTKLWAGKIPTYDAEEIVSILNAAGIEIDED